jgi:protoheme IX farnesyltransferase
VIGGIAGSAAAWAGWSAATGSMDLLGFLIGFLVFVWTPSHFWCLAMKIKDEYAKAEVPMLPVVIGMQKTSKFILGNTLILIPYSLILSFIPDGMGIVYTVIAIVSGALMLVYHYKLTKNPTSEFAWKAYKVTAPYLTIIFVAVALDAAFHFPLF